jgi:GNAT superfamily N-acetyltransferase
VEYQIVRETRLADYADVPIAFEVTEQLEVIPATARGGLPRLRSRPVDPPYVKDYDAIEGCRPTDWPEGWDVSRGWIAACFAGNERVGGASVALDIAVPGMPAGGRDVAVLWDIRVRPDFRRRGVGARLFAAAEAWARSAGCRRLVVETQTVNVPACRFYARQGCVLASVEPLAYPDFPGETRLIWGKELAGPAAHLSLVGNSGCR